MATWQHLRSSTANKRPTTSLADGRIAINTNTASPGLFFKDSAGTGIVKVGPVHVGTTAPNSVPAAGGSSGNYTGEQWLDTSVSPAQMKVWNGSTWVGIVADELPVSKLQDGAARQLIQTDAAGTGVEWTSDVDVPGTLDVTSTATFDSIAQHPLGTAGAPTITFTGDNNTGIYSPGADQVAISTGGSGNIFFRNGRIGVGESNPTGLIEWRSTNIGRLEADASTVIVNAATNAPLVFKQNDTEKMRLTSTGLGVGTSSPSYTIDVNGTARFNGSTVINGSSLDINPSSGQPNITLRSGNTFRGYIEGNSSGGLTFGSGPSATTAMTIDSSQRVGVGTTSPSTILDIVGAGNPTLTIRGSDGAYSGFINIQSAGGGSSVVNATGGTNALTFQTNSTERLRIDSSGRVGIGTSIPGAGLHVANTPIWAGANTNSSSGVIAMYGDGNNGTIEAFAGNNTSTKRNICLAPYGGSVAIGTTSPARQFTVYNSSAPIIQLVNSTTGDTVNDGVMLYESGSDFVIENQEAGNVRIHNNGSERMRIDSSGRLLVGTSSALTGTTTQYSKLVHLGNVAGGTGSGILCLGVGDSPSNVLSGYNIGRIFFTDNNAGEFASIVCQADANAGSGDYPGRLVFSTTADGASSPTERMRIVSTGQVLIGGNSTSPHTNADGVSISKAAGVLVGVTDVHAAIFARHNSDGECVRFQRNNTDVGSIDVTTTATSYNTSSDHRLKENVTPVSDGITRLQQLKPSRFNFIADPDKTVDGFLAHEVQTIVPEAITGEKDAVDADGKPIYQGIDQSKLVPLLTAALQEAVARIETLEAKVAALESV